MSQRGRAAGPAGMSYPLLPLFPDSGQTKLPLSDLSAWLQPSQAITGTHFYQWVVRWVDFTGVLTQPDLLTWKAGLS